jgi:LPXTG-motif cell wall-anchored protein
MTFVWGTLFLGRALAANLYPPNGPPGEPGKGHVDPTLPFTGARVSVWMILLVGLVVAGAVLLVVDRRRKAQPDD